MIKIRTMQKGDFEACEKISAEGIPQESWKIRDFEAAAKNPQAMMIVAASANQIAGYIVSYFAADEAELDSIAVSSAFRRQGIGKSLMQEYYRKLKEKSVNSIYLEVRESNSTAISFYKEEGFESFSKRPHFYEAPVEDAVLMRKIMN